MIGIENDMRAHFFGPGASTAHTTRALRETIRRVRSLELDIRDADGVRGSSPSTGTQIELVIHTAAQPSHDWAASDPQTDFAVNAIGTLNLLEAHAQARSGRDVHLHLDEQGLRRPSQPAAAGGARHALELPEEHRYYGGIDTTMSIDQSMHSLFGVSKASADLLVQEYGRYFEDADGLLPRRLPDRPQPCGRRSCTGSSPT